MGSERQLDDERQEGMRVAQTCLWFRSFCFGRRQCVRGGGSPGKEAVEPSEVEGHLGSQRQVSGKRKASLCQMPS